MGVQQFSWLGHAQEKLQGQDVSTGMEILHGELCSLRRDLGPEGWKHCLQNDLRTHPVFQLVQEDPFTRRALEKPRGYAGDAELIDYLYGEKNLCLGTSPIGAEVSRYMSEQPSAFSVRQRRDWLAQRIDTVAQERPDARILSIACGHLREAQRSVAVQENRIEELIALDQDLESLAVIQQEQGEHPIRTVQGSVRSLLKGELTFSDLDFVYSAGLYDYLAESAAQRLTQVMFRMLRPGGRLLVANFGDDPPEVGYMESAMDWWLIHRNEDQVSAFSAQIPRHEIAEKRLYWDDQKNVIYLELFKA